MEPVLTGIPELRIAAILLFALAAGCAGEAKKETPTPLMVERSLLEPKQDKASAAAAAPAKTAAEIPAPAPAVEPPRKAEVPPAAVKKGEAPPAVVKKAEAPPAAVKQAEPQLDIAGLTARLRETNSIGVFTKLALKNQVDDLLKQFRAYYQSGLQTGLGALRQPYDMLVLKVLALIQDGDPSLARMIAGSREAIWAILSDREKFNAAT